MGILKNSRKSVLLNVYIESNMDKDFFILSSRKDAFFIIDLCGRLVFVNPLLEQLVDYSQTELLSMELCDLFGEKGLNKYGDFFEGKDPETLNNFDVQVVTRGEQVLNVNITSFPIYFEEEFLGSYIVLKNVTSFKVKRELKAEKEKHFWQLVEHSPEPIFIIQNSEIKKINKRAISLLGFNEQNKWTGSSLLEFIHPESQELFKQKISRVFHADIPEPFEQKMIRLDGDVLIVEMTAFPTIYNGEPGCHLIVKDISENRRLSLVSQKQAIAGQLAAGLAHEIRNPITAIKGFLQLILRENVENQRVFLEIIDSEITRIEAILKELLVLAKPGKHKEEWVNIRDLLEQVVTLMESQALLNNVQIQKQLSSVNAMVRGDENQLKQVFINYIKNSIDAMADGGKLIISGMTIGENSVQIKVIDQGGGIPQEIIDKVGNPFFTTKENGTGLGMLVSNQIIKDHKGSMFIKSDAIGTCVEVHLPAKL
ncbi:PAS domain S-box protein [Bacillus sp. B15-48]|uniref:PAS domain S-box protein n=1 Tax=Bacillus sp. B15-48 TaxID=1548601 RepID=UPI00193F5CB4|nr:PAS domain S-box protein [Bacillus sp. B15-48]MBM4764406.1 PAS domain S-box protein [Bacillus sp. B15-48]